MYQPVPRTAVHEPPRPPAHFEQMAFSAMPRYMIDSIESSTMYR